jgi:hypothetical protein
MNVWTCDDHDTFYPVGAASVVVAPTIEEARALLDKALVEKGLRPSGEKPYTLLPLSTARPVAVILVDGNY